MSIQQFIKKMCLKLGTNNKAIYPVIAIAAANGICRPTITMLKKGEDPQSKKYAALREGITEFIAIPTYWACGELAGKLGKYITSKAMDKKIAELEKNGSKITADTKKIMKESMVKKGQAGLMLIGVCFAAGVVIPALCSVAVKPIMKKTAPQKETPAINPIQKYSYLDNRQVFRNISYSGMKVGGV